MKKVLFQEKQSFTQWWLWTILLGIAVFPSVMLLWRWTMPTLYLSLFGVGLLVFFASLRMHTKITEDEINVRYFPFLNKRFLWTDIKKAEILDYGFVGGWGIRLWTDYGTVYNVGGSKGLFIQTGGKAYVIGSQKHDELKASLQEFLEQQYGK